MALSTGFREIDWPRLEQTESGNGRPSRLMIPAKRLIPIDLLNYVRSPLVAGALQRRRSTSLRIRLARGRDCPTRAAITTDPCYEKQSPLRMWSRRQFLTLSTTAKTFGRKRHSDSKSVRRLFPSLPECSCGYLRSRE